MLYWVSATNGSAGGDGSQQNPFLTIEQAQQVVRTVLQAPGTLDEAYASVSRLLGVATEGERSSLAALGKHRA